MGEDTEREIKIEECKKSLKHLTVRIWFLFLLCLIGGFIFRWAEGTTTSTSDNKKYDIKKVREDLIESLWQDRLMSADNWKTVAQTQLVKLEDEFHNSNDEGMDADSGIKTWNFANSVFYSMTLMTTIGYGHVSPVTFFGKLFTIIYSLIGIPMFSIVLCNAGKVLTLAIKLQLTKNRENRKDYSIDDEFNFPVTTGLLMLLIYALIGAIFFYFTEAEWGIWGSLYFIFVTFSTVGLGDLVPNNPIIAVLTSLYFLFGLALTSLVLGAIQEKLDQPLQNFTQRTAFLIGLSPSSEEHPEDSEEQTKQVKAD